MAPNSRNTNEDYWSEYDGLQYAKHQLLSKYLAGWFPILCSWSGRVLYIDCHAGRGRHITGHKGSPILALETLHNHKACSQILGSTLVDFVFFEVDQSNYEHLRDEIETIRWQSRNVNIRCFHSDYETELRIILDEYEHGDRKLGPTFAFVDPYGFRLSMDLLNKLLDVPHCEILINFMYRYVDMAMQNPSQVENLDVLFGCREWCQLAGIDDYERRSQETITLFASQLSAKFVTHMHMRARNGVLKYVLFHATNDQRGREVIKDAMWSVTPDGSFTAFEHHHPDQLVLIMPEPNLEPLKDLLWEHFSGQQIRMAKIEDWLLGQLYRKTHLYKILREYRHAGVIAFSDYQGRFGLGKNPLVHFPPHRPVEAQNLTFF